MDASLSKAEQACLHLVRQIQRDGRLAYLIGPCSRSYELLTEAVAEIDGKDVKEICAEIEPNIRPVRLTPFHPLTERE